MNKLTLLLIMVLCVNSRVHSQSAKREWEQGKLKWSDFQSLPLRSSNMASELVYQISFVTEKTKFQDTVLFTFVTKNEMNPKYSWVKPEEKSDLLLRYNQVLFDAMEINRRRLQYDLLEMYDISQTNSILQGALSNCQNEIRKIQEETNFGRNKEAVVYWEFLINTTLLDLPLFRIPPFKESAFGYGLHVGLGVGNFSNTLSDYFSPTFNFLFGFDVALNNTILYLNGTLALNNVSSEFQDNGRTWPKDLKTNVAIIDVSLGQNIINNGKHRLTPFVGLGILEFTASQDKDQFEDYRLVDYGVIYGINYDFKFRKTIKLIPSFGGIRENTNQSIRTRLYILSSQFEKFKGTSINLTVSYSFFSRVIKH
jgi:hypothetical protein